MINDNAGVIVAIFVIPKKDVKGSEKMKNQWMLFKFVSCYYFNYSGLQSD